MNHKNQWKWTDVDWFYILSKNLVFRFGSHLEEITDGLNLIFGEYCCENVIQYLLGDQQQESEIERRFDTFGYSVEEMHVWLEKHNALPVAQYDYKSRPLSIA